MDVKNVFVLVLIFTANSVVEGFDEDDNQSTPSSNFDSTTSRERATEAGIQRLDSTSKTPLQSTETTQISNNITANETNYDVTEKSTRNKLVITTPLSAVSSVTSMKTNVQSSTTTLPSKFSSEKEVSLAATTANFRLDLLYNSSPNTLALSHSTKEYVSSIAPKMITAEIPSEVKNSEGKNTTLNPTDNKINSTITVGHSAVTSTPGNMNNTAERHKLSSISSKTTAKADQTQAQNNELFTNGAATNLRHSATQHSPMFTNSIVIKPQHSSTQSSLSFTNSVATRAQYSTSQNSKLFTNKTATNSQPPTIKTVSKGNVSNKTNSTTITLTSIPVDITSAPSNITSAPPNSYMTSAPETTNTQTYSSPNAVESTVNIFSSSTQKVAAGGGFVDDDDDTYWPVAMALTIGIPTIIVFAVTIIVLYRRRKAKSFINSPYHTF